MRLIPTIEIEPGRYSVSRRPHPASSDADADWGAWFIACLAEAGIHELRPIRPRRWFLAVDQLVNPRTIGRILADHFEASIADAAADPECARPLSGGFVLEYQGKAIVEPACCGDLAILRGAAPAMAMTGSNGGRRSFGDAGG